MHASAGRGREIGAGGCSCLLYIGGGDVDFGVAEACAFFWFSFLLCLFFLFSLTSVFVSASPAAGSYLLPILLFYLSIVS